MVSDNQSTSDLTSTDTVLISQSHTSQCPPLGKACSSMRHTHSHNGTCTYSHMHTHIYTHAHTHTQHTHTHTSGGSRNLERGVQPRAHEKLPKTLGFPRPLPVTLSIHDTRNYCCY